MHPIFRQQQWWRRYSSVETAIEEEEYEPPIKQEISSRTQFPTVITASSEGWLPGASRVCYHWHCGLWLVNGGYEIVSSVENVWRDKRFMVDPWNCGKVAPPVVNIVGGRFPFFFCWRTNEQTDGTGNGWWLVFGPLKDVCLSGLFNLQHIPPSLHVSTVFADFYHKPQRGLLVGMCRRDTGW